MIMMCYIHHAQQANIYPREIIETQEQGVKHFQSSQ